MDNSNDSHALYPTSCLDLKLIFIDNQKRRNRRKRRSQSAKSSAAAPSVEAKRSRSVSSCDDDQVSDDSLIVSDKITQDSVPVSEQSRQLAERIHKMKEKFLDQKFSSASNSISTEQDLITNGRDNTTPTYVDDQFATTAATTLAEDQPALYEGVSKRVFPSWNNLHMPQVEAPTIISICEFF